MTTEEAIKIIVCMRTLPPQIDYVTPTDKRSYIAAIAFIDSLPKGECLEAYKSVEAVINKYYDPNELGYSTAYLDARF